MTVLVRYLLPLVFLFAVLGVSHGEDRTFDGSGNNVNFPDQGASNQPLVRIVYPAFNPPVNAEVLNPNLPSPRMVSNAVSRQPLSVPSARGLSDYIWGWGQFLAHDLSLTLTSNGADQNGSAPIPIGENDFLQPGPLPFIRSDFVTEDDIPDPSRISPFTCVVDCREQINVNTSYIDASTVYGSTPERAAALRTEDGLGARLLVSENNLLPLNSMGLENENTGRFADEQLFAAGDLRANENVMLTSLHTVFMREHNRLVDTIESARPELSSEETFQLARKLVGAQVQAITYNEFLPALLGPNAPNAEDFSYDEDVIATATQSFSHGVNRWGHSATSPQLKMVDADGVELDSLKLRDAFSNPVAITDHPEMIDSVLRGAATQVSQEIDTLVVDELRNLLFAAPGQGGLDLVALNINRGRDHGLPPFFFLQAFYEVSDPTNDFEDFRERVVEPLQTVYEDVFNMDAWVGAMAQPPLPDSSMGRLGTTIIADQFERLRDGDRLFYRSEDAGLYEDGELMDEFKQLIDLDSVTLAQVIRNNSGVSRLQQNIFFIPPDLDFNGDDAIDAADIDFLGDSIRDDQFERELDLSGDGMLSMDDHHRMVREMNTIRGDTNLDGMVDFTDFLRLSDSFGGFGGWADGDFDASGTVEFADFLELSENFGVTATQSVPEPNVNWQVGLMALLFVQMQWLRGCRAVAPRA